MRIDSARLGAARLCGGENGTFLFRKGSGAALLGRYGSPLHGLPGTFRSKTRGAGEEAPARHQPAAAHLCDAVGKEDPAKRGAYAASASRSGRTGLERQFYWEKIQGKPITNKQEAFTIQSTFN